LNIIKLPTIAGKMMNKTAIAMLLGLGISVLAGRVNAEGMASQFKELPDLTTQECLATVDNAISQQTQYYHRIVTEGASRKLFYEDPSGFIELICSDNRIDVTVSFPSEFNDAEAEEVAHDILMDIFSPRLNIA
jgi:hypothetical protein